MLSLNKTKSRDELASWLGAHAGILSWKMDGLTIVLTYSNGELVKAVTRGNGEVGEVITANARAFKNVPLKIAFKGDLVLRGEAVIRYSDFERINAAIPDIESRYKNPRNLCSGSVRQLDSRITAQRSVYLYAFALISLTGREAFTFRHEQLDFLKELGFDVVEYEPIDSGNVADAVKHFADRIEGNDFPSDGLVLIYDDISYGQSLGRTAKYPRDGIAFKWADEQAETTLREIEWSPSRTGLINPVAIFDPVELEGTTVTRASVHNISILEELKLAPGDRIKVYKANMIIPQISENLSCTGSFSVCAQNDAEPAAAAEPDSVNGPIPIYGTDLVYSNPVVTRFCPVCGRQTSVHDDNGVRTLYCINPDCTAKKVGLFAHMASRDALNIEGLSEATVEKLISEGIVHKQSDIFRLFEHASKISALEGFGDKSCANLLASVEKARTSTLSRLIYSLGIPNIGLANARVICKYVCDDPLLIPKLTAEELVTIEGIGDVLAASFTEFFRREDNLGLYNDFLNELVLESDAPAGSTLEGRTFVITGSVEHFANRNELKAFIESQGGKVTGSVTKNTDYLINNDIASNSTKNKTAKELGVSIITEEDFLKMVNP